MEVKEIVKNLNPEHQYKCGECEDGLAIVSIGGKFNLCLVCFIQMCGEMETVMIEHAKRLIAKEG